jgi:VanZ family protein
MYALENVPMSATPALFPPSRVAPSQAVRAPRQSVQQAWMAVLFSIIFVCFTSTSFMGGSHTQILVNVVWRTFLGARHWDLTAPVNIACRKVGHFLGYGVIGLIFRNAWNSSVRVGLIRIGAGLATLRGMVSISALAVLSTFILASLDELHQRFVPGRVSSFRDVMVDTTGAIFLNVVFWTARAYRRNKALNAS